MSSFTAVMDNICTRPADAVVCACGPHCHHGSSGGLAKAIEQAAGPQLKAYCEEHQMSMEYGEALTTPAFDMPHQGIIHATGPPWRGGNNNEPQQLAAAHQRLVHLAAENNWRHVLIPAISCGIFGYDPRLAAPIAVHSVVDAANELGFDMHAEWVFMDNDHYGIWRRALQTLTVA